MQFAVIFVLVAVGWFIIGEIATRINGCIMSLKLARIMGSTRENVDKLITEVVEKDGGDAHPNKWMLIWNSLTWPNSLYYAFIGYRRIKKYIETTNRTGNTACNRGGDPR